MKLHEIIESDGFKRKIIDFDSEGRPVTTPYDDEEETEEPKETVEKVEETAKAEAEVFNCQYCGREIKSKAGLASHEKSCKENPTNK